MKRLYLLLLGIGVLLFGIGCGFMIETEIIIFGIGAAFSPFIGLGIMLYAYFAEDGALEKKDSDQPKE